jgi:hypothetical protein
LLLLIFTTAGEETSTSSEKLGNWLLALCMFKDTKSVNKGNTANNLPIILS